MQSAIGCCGSTRTPVGHEGYLVRLDSGSALEPLRAGDHANLTRRLVPHGPDSPVHEGWDIYLEMTLAPGETRALTHYNHAGGAGVTGR